MNNLTKTLHITELAEKMKNREFSLLCCASFEKRSQCVPQALSVIPIKRVSIFSTEASKSICNSAEVIKSFFENEVYLIKLRKDDSISISRSIANEINEIINNGIRDIVIDISTFTHEILLILLMLIYKKRKSFDRITCIYTGAKDYSVGDPTERKWLSKGCKDVRTIIGFPGLILPRKPTCLIVLVGFEHERAAKMIAEMDPELLVIGKGLPTNEHIISECHKAPMLYFHKLVNDMVSNRGDVRSFEFSCRDINETVKSLRKQIEEAKDFNHIIIPLNTKISTVAVALTALNDPKIQVCYAEPETYNYTNYSEPDDKVTIFDLNYNV